MTPDHCPECRKVGVIATKRGPTCTHHERTGVKWWPVEWLLMDEAARVAWIWANRGK